MLEWKTRFTRKTVTLKLGKREFEGKEHDVLIMDYGEVRKYAIRLDAISKIRHNLKRQENIVVSSPNWSRRGRSFYFENTEQAHSFFKALREEIEKVKKPKEVGLGIVEYEVTS